MKYYAEYNFGKTTKNLSSRVLPTLQIQGEDLARLNKGENCELPPHPPWWESFIYKGWQPW